MGSLEYLTLGIVALAGMIFGSFATVLCYRIPREIPLGLKTHKRSACPHCKKLIPWSQNIPILSYLFLRGRCAQCQKKIPLRYLLIELTTTLSFISTYLIYIHSPNQNLEGFTYYAELVKLLYFTLALVAVVFIDLEFRIIPDRFSLGGWVIALAASFLWAQPPPWISIAGGLFGFGIFFLLAWGYEKIKGIEGLGFGDVKMMGWLGSWIGFFGVPFIVLIASLTGLLVGIGAMRFSKKGMQTAIPFGPFLAVAAYLAWSIQTLGLWGF